MTTSKWAESMRSRESPKVGRHCRHDPTVRHPPSKKAPHRQLLEGCGVYRVRYKRRARRELTPGPIMLGATRSRALEPRRTLLRFLVEELTFVHGPMLSGGGRRAGRGCGGQSIKRGARRGRGEISFFKLSAFFARSAFTSVSASSESVSAFSSRNRLRALSTYLVPSHPKF